MAAHMGLRGGLGIGRGRPWRRAARGRGGPVTSENEVAAAAEVPSTRDRVVEHVRRLIESGVLHPGDRLPSERDLALELGLSRPSVRSGLEALESMGVVVSRRGAGTYIANGPPTLGTEPLSLLASLHGFSQNEMFEARLVLEVGVAALAAVNSSPEQLATMAEEVTEMFASLEDPAAFLLHDVRFHRAVADGCGNRVLAALMEMVSAQFYQLRKETISRARDLRESAEMHRRVYRAIRARDAE
ncbi:MAG TPA: FadR family transcriptional regulator, partial [Chromatiales bacterium]|nr:FadR family transcriptional regulator [Chromatiales bacterium]